MRRLAIAAALAAVPVVSFAATSHADSASRQRHNDYYYKSYDTAYRPVCVTRNIHMTDEEGNTAVETVRICR